MLGLPLLSRHPVDIRYEQLGVTLSPIDVGSSLHNLLVEYMHNTHAETHSQYELHLEQVGHVQTSAPHPI